MVLDINVRQQNIPNAGVTSAPTAGAQASAPINVPVGQGSGVENTNTNYNTNNSAQSQPQTKRTAKELYNAVAPKLAQYGINLSEAETLALLERVAGCKQEILLNLENTEIQKHLQCLEAALKKLGKNGAEIDINALGELANDYNIAIHTGWTIEGFEKAQSKGQESLKERLERVYPGKSMEEALELYFTAYFDSVIADKIKNAKTPEEKEQIIKQEKLRQLQDFGKLLANSSDEEMAYFKEAIKSLYANNKIKGFDALMKSLDSQEARTELADSCSPEYIEEIALTQDRFGDCSGSDEIAGITNIIAREQSLEGRNEFHKDFNEKAVEFFEENKETIKVINEKIKNGEELTPEEQELRNKIINYYQAVTEGEFTGTASNLNLNNDERKNLLLTINNDTYSINENYDNSFYREVMQNINEYVEAHPETLAMSEDDFVKLMDEVTSGNYTTVVNDVANGTVTELVQPQEPKSSATKASSTEVVTQPNFGVERREAPINTKTGVGDLYQEQTPIVNTPSTSNVGTTPILPTSKQDIVSITRTGGVKALCDFAQSNGAFKTVVEVYNNLSDITNQAVISYAQKMYNMLNHNRQEFVLRSVASSSASGFNELLAQTSDQVVLNLGDNFTSFYTKQQVEQAKEKAQEKIQHGLA